MKLFFSVKIFFILSFLSYLCLFHVKIFAVNHVVLIGVDGLNVRGLLKARTPTIQSLVNEGSYTFNGRSTRPSSSAVNWASMLMGASVAEHGVTSNDWTREDYILPPMTTGVEDIFPTIFSVLHSEKPNLTSAVVYTWKGISKLYEHSVVHFQKWTNNDEKTVEHSVSLIKESKPNFLFIHIDAPDAAGHGFGHDSAEYLQTIERVDGFIKRILEAIKIAGIENDTTVILSTDHGGIGRGHGGDLPEEMKTPVIIKGPNIKKSYQITDPVYVFDIAATIARIFKLNPPKAWIGKAIDSVFVSSVSDSNRFDKMVTVPTTSPQEGLFSAPVLLSLKAPPDHQIHYTTDGSLPTSNSALYQQPFLLNESTVVRARSYLNNRFSPVMTKSFRIKSNNPENGLLASYYEINPTCSLPHFEQLQPKSVTNVQEINENTILHREYCFALHFKGFLKIEEDDIYTFFIRSDDGSSLSIGDSVLIDNDGCHRIQEKSATVFLKKGLHPISVSYLQNDGGVFLNVLYKNSKLPLQIIPPQVLFTQ